MTQRSLAPINFDMSAAAIAEIAHLRALWDRKFADPADAVAIAWGTTVLHSGERWDGVVVSFYGRSERHYIEEAIEHAFGMDVVFFVTESDHGRFHGKTLDFAEGRGFSPANLSASREYFGRAPERAAYAAGCSAPVRSWKSGPFVVFAT